MSQPSVSVVIPARDAEDTLPRLLDSLARDVKSAGHEVIVVDNGSRDATAELAERSSAVTSVIRRRRGAGPGAARNDGAKAAAAPVIAFIDADCYAAPGWLQAGVAAIAQADLVQGQVLPDPAVPLGPYDRTLFVRRANGLFESANLFVRRDLVMRVGGFPDGLESEIGTGGDGAPFGEDVIFGWLARRTGARSAFCADALAYHAVRRREVSGFVAERRRLELFPRLAARVPELREAFFYRRVFLSPRSAKYDLALLGAVLAVLSTRRLPLLAGVPYLSDVVLSAKRWGRRQCPGVAASEVVADTVGAWALARGSIAARRVVL
jgi:glycosyltransferase involved in cell wall biosynthesis